MKHTLKLTIVLLILFLVSQIVGLVVVNQYIDKEKSELTGETEWKTLPYGQERPPVEKTWSIIFIIIAVLMGTALALLLIKVGFWWIWKIWFFFAVWLCVAFAFSAFINQYIALTIAAALAFFKLFRPNVILHNLTEIFIYAGIAAILVPIIKYLWVAILILVIISVYDFWAVFKSKHMILLAKEQAKHRVFAGLLLPYGGKIKKLTESEIKKKKIKLPKKELKLAKAEAKQKGEKKLKIRSYQTAILGGGDMAFALLFTGVAMRYVGFTYALIIPIFTTIALGYILIKGRKDRFYPAMPFISAGCLIGFGASYLVYLL
ncbi:hypothetical protein KY326_04870 [Candidatus Woesearchaeota archaeon]|nr:hypothetical protein [Candidatus Woesearchaeota archaeon]